MMSLKKKKRKMMMMKCWIRSVRRDASDGKTRTLNIYNHTVIVLKEAYKLKYDYVCINYVNFT